MGENNLDKPFGKYFDHTILKPEAGEGDIRTLCKEARDHGLYSVCVNTCYVALAKKELAESDVKIAAVVGFPLGACACEVKAAEAAYACKNGADEVDMVINVGAMKDRRYEAVHSDIVAVVEACKGVHVHDMKWKGTSAEAVPKVKVILETCLLTDEEIVKACEIARDAGADFVKTSTGFSTAGATVHHVRLMRETVGNTMGVKASGGIRDYETAMAMIEAGADRIGASKLILSK